MDENKVSLLRKENPMAVKTKDEIMALIKDKFGDDTSDETLAFIEDVADTVNDLETKASGDGVDWKAKYEQNDKEWRQRYHDRFFSAEPAPDPDPDPEPEDNSPKTFDELFDVKG